MAIQVTCGCGASYSLKDDLAGKEVQCPKCGAVQRAGGGDAPPPGDPSTDPVFRRNKFLLRQKHLAISEKYYVWDESGAELLFVERPAHLLKGMLAALCGIVAAAVVWAGLGFLTSLAGEGAKPILIVVTALAGFFALFAVAVGLSPLRHVTIYRDDSKRETLLRVLQNERWAFPTVTFSLLDASGLPLARFAKNRLYDIFRKRWRVESPDGRRVATAFEDSILLSLLRRLLGPLFGALRTNFIITRGESEDVIGEFNRKFTLLDRYVLDMSADGSGVLDRRIAVALGVMLDTGEKR